MAGTLYLIPVSLGSDPEEVLPASNTAIIAPLRHFVVEEIRTARRFLRKLLPDFPIDDCDFQTLNEHTRASELPKLLAPLKAGHPMGLLSEAGCPGVADPGSPVIALAHQWNILVKPLTGPSSILLSLMASGLNGQNFAFNGYLPTDPHQRTQKIKALEKRCLHENQTQIFMETPYRNRHLFQSLLQTLEPDTFLCIAINLTLPEEFIRLAPANTWKSWTPPPLEKQPAIFLIGRNPFH